MLPPVLNTRLCITIIPQLAVNCKGICISFRLLSESLRYGYDRMFHSSPHSICCPETEKNGDPPQKGSSIRVILCCVVCEYWCGARELSYNGTAATRLSGRPAMCEIKRADVFPQQPCACPTMKFHKWHLIK